MRLYKFTVNGNKTFPLDMLRYDACWPADSETIDSISISYRDREDYTTPRSARFLSTRKPTEGRWASFSWPVIKTELVG